MVRKITPTSGGWRKRPGIPDTQSEFERSASRALRSLPSNSPTWRADTIRKLTDPLLRRRLSPTILRAIHTLVAQLVELEAPVLPEVTTTAEATIDAVARRARLRGLLAFQNNADQLTHEWLTALSEIITLIADATPDYIKNTNAPNVLSVPLIDLVSDPAALISHIVTHMLRFAADDPFAYRPGAILARLCKDALLNVSKLNEESARKNPYRVISPAQSGLVASELAAAYLAGTPFLEFFRTLLPFTIPHRAFRAHGCVFAPSDHGKTQTLQAIIVSLLHEPDPPGLFIMDSMGAMLKKLRRLAIFDSRLRGRLVILDPAGPRPPALNFFKLSGGSPAQQMELLFYLFKALDQTLTARQKTTVTFLAQLMQKIDGTLDDLRKVCEDKQPRHLEVINALPPVVRDFFLNAFYKPDTLMTQTKTQIAARLYTLAATPISQMFSAKDNTFNAFDCIQQKKIVLVNTDRLTLGDDGSTIFGRFVLAQCLAAAFARAPIDEDKRHLALLIVDEAKAYFDEQTEKFLSDARQFGLGLLFATQYVSQLSEGVRRAVYANTAIKLIGPIEYSDRVNLAREMNTTPEFIGSMRGYDGSHTEWALHVRTSNMTPSALRLRVPYGVLERMPTTQNALQVDDPAPIPPTPTPATPAPAPQPRQPNERSVRPTDLPPAGQKPETVDPRKPTAREEPLIKPGKDW